MSDDEIPQRLLTPEQEALAVLDTEALAEAFAEASKAMSAADAAHEQTRRAYREATRKLDLVIMEKEFRVRPNIDHQNNIRAYLDGQQKQRLERAERQKVLDELVGNKSSKLDKALKERKRDAKLAA